MPSKQVERIGAAEEARVARWFRDGTHGLVYFDREGRAIPISDAEHERWRGEALFRVDKYVEDLDRAPKEILIVAVCVFVAAYFLKTTLGAVLPVFKSIQPALFTMPACLLPLVYEFAFRRDQAALRRRIEEKLFLRTPLPAEVASGRRRHNVFAIAQGVTAGAAILVAAVATFSDRPGFGTWAIFAFLGFAFLFSLAAQRVDAVHRRRLW